MAWEENSCICLNMQLIAILSRIGVIIVKFFWLHMVEGWLPVHVSISVAALLFPATIGESVGSCLGPAAQEVLSRHLSTPSVHPC